MATSLFGYLPMIKSYPIKKNNITSAPDTPTHNNNFAKNNLSHCIWRTYGPNGFNPDGYRGARACDRVKQTTILLNINRPFIFKNNMFRRLNFKRASGEHRRGISLSCKEIFLIRDNILNNFSKKMQCLWVHKHKFVNWTNTIL